MHRQWLARLMLVGLLAASPVLVTGEETRPQILVVMQRDHPRVLQQVARELGFRHKLDPLAAWDMASLDLHCIVFAPRARAAPLAQLLERLGAEPRVELAQPVQHFELLTDGASDPYRGLQHAASELRLEQAHRLATGQGVKVAVVDTGIDVAHPDLRGRVTVARNFVRAAGEGFTGDRHGTAVAGVLAATGANGIGILGVAPAVELLALKACWQIGAGSPEATCDSYTLALALDFAIVSGARIVNLSLEGPQDPLLERLIVKAVERGITVVAAAGSEGSRFPASLGSVVAVVASSPAGEPPGAPSAGPNRVAAPGVDVLTTVPGGGYDFLSGASIAAAQVSGVAALLLEKRPALAPAEVREVLRSTGEGGGNPHPPKVDACRALAKVLAAGPGVCGAQIPG